MSEARTKRFVYSPGGPGDGGDERERLDRFLAAREDSLTRSQLKRLIESGQVSVAGQVVTRSALRLAPGDVVDVVIPAPTEARARAQEIPLDVLFEDAHLIVLDKPAGMVVHPAPGHPDGTLVNALLAHCDDLSGVGGELRPGIVHRLDKDTSGVMVASKTDAAHLGLAALFKGHDIEREYLAVVAPPPRADAATFSTLHGRHPTQRKKFSARVARGKPAITHYQVERRFGGLAALVRSRLETGRTHQIRVHFSEHGSPLIGDPLYGRRHRGSPPLAEAAARLGRQALHAAVLGFVHPVTRERMRFASDMPADMRALVAELALLDP